MAVACIGACSRASNSCPKRLPPALNPNPCWLLDYLYPALQGPEVSKWDLVRQLVGTAFSDTLCLKPVRIEVEGLLDAHGLSGSWKASIAQGALPLPSGTRLLSGELRPSELARAAGAIASALVAVGLRSGSFVTEGTSLYISSLRRIVEIADCARDNLGAPKRLVLVYGW
jgi:hypothetical protein